MSLIPVLSLVNVTNAPRKLNETNYVAYDLKLTDVYGDKTFEGAT